MLFYYLVTKLNKMIKKIFILIFFLFFKINISASNINVIYEWTDYNDIIEDYVVNNKTTILRHANHAYKQSLNYRDYIKKVSKKYNVPEELYIIAAIESSFNPNAVSHAGAVGMWQFMKPTSKDMGLKITSYVDERRNWQKSTDAGIRYLKYLAEVHFDGDYELAVLAYNAGVGRVKRAINKNQTNDVWLLIQDKSSFAKESREYLPKFLTFVQYFKHLENN